MEINETAFNIPSFVLACIPKSRPLTQSELIVKYIQLCERNHVLPLAGQLKTAIKRLYDLGAISFEVANGVKRIRKH